MELRLIWRVFWRWWWVIVIPPVVVGALVLPRLLNRETGGGGFYTQFKYTAAQIDSNVQPRDGDFQDVWLASEFTVNAFTEWIRSSTFRDELALQLGADVDLGALGIATDNARSIGKVEMSHPDEAVLTKIAQASIVILQTRNQDYFPHLGGEAAQVTIVDAPRVVASPPPLTNRFDPIIRVGIALMAGMLLALVFEYLTPFVRHSDELEGMGMRVLAKIPKA
jgi:hypothetical protein